MRRSGIRRVIHVAGRDPATLRDEVSEEIRHHLELSIESLIAQGLAPHEARAEAERRIGTLEAAEQLLYESAQQRDRKVLLRERIGDLMTELRYVLRGYRRQPALVSLVVVTLALGIGANASIFPMVDRLLFRTPSGLANPDELRRAYINLHLQGGREEARVAFSYPELESIRRALGQRAEVAAYLPDIRAAVDGDTAQSRLVGMSYATGNLLPTLGARIARGRNFSEEENRLDDPHLVAIVSHNLWVTRFGNDPNIVGRRAKFGSREYTIIGVTAEGFAGIDLLPNDIWVPIANQRTIRSPGRNWWEVKGVSAWQIITRSSESAVDAMSRDASAAYMDAAWRGEGQAPQAAHVSFGSIIRARGPLKPTQERLISTRLLGVSLVLLLVALANVTNLLIARGLGREREIAVRRALGVGRGRLASVFVLEAAVIAIAAGVVATGVSFALSRVVRSLLLPDAAWNPSVFDVRANAFTVALAMVCAMFAGVIPAWHALRNDPANLLRGGTRDGGVRRTWLRTGFLGAQAALSAVLLIGTGLFVVSLDRVQHADVGYDLDRLAAFSPAYAKGNEQFLPQLQQILDARPDVESTALAATIPLRSAWSDVTFIAGRDSALSDELTPVVNAVSSTFVKTMGMQMVRGRTFSPDDRAGSAPVALVSEEAARRIWPGRDAIGESICLGETNRRCYTIIGITKNVRKFRVIEEPTIMAWVPAEQVPQGTQIGSIVIRARTNPQTVLNAATEEWKRLTGQTAAPQATAYTTWIEPQLRSWKLGAKLFGAVSTLAMILALVGLYSVLSAAVAQRSRELGIRMALGATGSSIIGLVVRQGVAVAATGVGIGLVIAAGASKVVAALLYETSPREPIVYAFVGAALLTGAALAAFIPAARATRIDPVRSLRAD